jgi:agmatinase
MTAGEVDATRAERSLGQLTRPAARTFFAAPACDDLDQLDAQVAFIGVPWDQGVILPVIRSGAYAGPKLVRDTRTRLKETRPDGTSAGWFDVETERMHLVGVRMADCGDVLVAGGDVQLSHDRITAACRAIAERGALVVAIGGDHSISFPVGRGVAEVRGPVDVVHLDAHPDFGDVIFGSKLSHGSQLRRLSELSTVEQISAIGLRAVDRDQFDDLKAHPVGIAATKAVLDEGPEAVVERLVRKDRDLYVSIDIDVLDGGIVPATTLPEPGGLSYRELRALLEAIARRGRVVGFDIVETSAAQPDLNTPMTTAWLIVHFLSAIFGEASTAG